MTNFDKQLTTKRGTPDVINSAKGHLALKSSATIDTKPPKSMVKSQKARDRVKRDVKSTELRKSIITRARSADGPRTREPLVDSQKLNIFRDTTSARSATARSDLNRSMYDMIQKMTANTTNRVPLKSYTNQNTARSEHENDHSMNRSFSKTQRNPGNTENLMFNAVNELLNPSLKAMSRLVAGRNYDVLDNHANFFKQPEKEFAPRINKRKAESKLVKTGLYNAPRPRSKNSARSGKDDHNNSTSAFEENYEPMDSARTTARSHNDKSEKSHVSTTQMPPQQPVNNNLQENLRKKELSMKRMTEKEEELKYLNFIKEVTDDIIARGVCTNRVINNVFEYHISRHKSHLDTVKMRELLDTLRKDIGIPTENDAQFDIDYSPSILKASRYDQETRNEKQSHKYDDPHEKYSILDKFGWTSDYEAPHPPTNLIHNRSASPALSNKDSSGNKKPTSVTSSKSTFSNEFQKQHSTIAQNIDSIRKTNSSHSASSTATESPKRVISEKSSFDKTDSRKVSPAESRKASVATNLSSPAHEKQKQSENISPASSRKSSTNDSPVQSRKGSGNLNSSNIFLNNKANSFTEDNDDNVKSEKSERTQNDFSTKPPRDNSRKNSSESTASNESNKNDREDVDKFLMATLKKPIKIDDDKDDDSDEDGITRQNTIKNKGQFQRKKSNDDDENDDLFNYDFGKKDDKSENEDEDSEDFDKMLTQTLKRHNFKQDLGRTMKFNDGNKSSDESETSLPKPAPRKILVPNSKLSSGSDSDEF